MSYILDALRKADAERARGSVPGLHAQPAAGADGAEAAPRRRPLRGVALAALAGLLAALGWWAGRESAPSPVPSPVAMAPAATQAPVATASVPPLPASQPPATPPLQLATAPPVAEVAPARSLITLPVPAPAPSVSASGAAVAPSVVASASPPTPSRLPLLAEMPADMRGQLPALTMGGSVYSDRPASRFVMINGQLLREGDTVAPGLVLESLRPKSAVLVFRGQRFEWPY